MIPAREGGKVSSGAKTTFPFKTQPSMPGLQALRTRLHWSLTWWGQEKLDKQNLRKALLAAGRW
jgi:hypothetical protein